MNILTSLITKHFKSASSHQIVSRNNLVYGCNLMPSIPHVRSFKWAKSTQQLSNGDLDAPRKTFLLRVSKWF